MKDIIKISALFIVSFISLLAIMTYILVTLQPDPVVVSESVVNDSTGFADSLNVGTAQKILLDQDNKVDSLQTLVSQMEREQKSLEQQLLPKETDLPADDVSSVKNVKQVAQIYENMQPQEAAIIMASLNINMAVEIISAMKGRQAARLLSSMDPDRAAEISKKLIVKH